MSPTDHAREAAISAASWWHGLRRVVDPETRFRARWAMKTELKRRRKARRVEITAALQEYRARHAAPEAAIGATPEAHS